MTVVVDARAMLKQAIQAGAKTLGDSCAESHIAMLDELSRKIIASFRSGGKVLLCGNGGSASQAQHIAAEFVGRFKREREGLPAIALTTDTSILTSLGNDYGYDLIFSRQIESLSRAGDVLIALSTSGNSPNVIKAVESAASRNLLIAAFTGRRGGKLGSMSPLVFRAPSDDTSHIQEAHITALHAVCDVVEAAFSS